MRSWDCGDAPRWVRVLAGHADALPGCLRYPATDSERALGWLRVLAGLLGLGRGWLRVDRRLRMMIFGVRIEWRGVNDRRHVVHGGRMGMLPVQDDAGFHEGGQNVHLTEVDPVPFGSDDRRSAT